MALRHFPFKHPTFGTAKAPKSANHWKVSVYYWWYEYLRRNEEYKKTCDRGGIGKLSELYAHFGNVHSGDFKSWWTKDERGARLFADPPTRSLKLLKTESDCLEHLNDETLVVSIPLGLPITHLVKNFRQLVSKHHIGKRGQRRTALSSAQFIPKGKVDVGFLEIALMVWDERKAHPKKPLWQVAQDIGIAGTHKVKSNDSAMVSRDKRNVLGAMTSRYYKKACTMIDKAGRGDFPH